MIERENFRTAICIGWRFGVLDWWSYKDLVVPPGYRGFTFSDSAGVNWYSSGRHRIWGLKELLAGKGKRLQVGIVHDGSWILFAKISNLISGDHQSVDVSLALRVTIVDFYKFLRVQESDDEFLRKPQIHEGLLSDLFQSLTQRYLADELISTRPHHFILNQIYSKVELFLGEVGLGLEKFEHMFFLLTEDSSFVVQEIGDHIQDLRPLRILGADSDLYKTGRMRPGSDRPKKSWLIGWGAAIVLLLWVSYDLSLVQAPRWFADVSSLALIGIQVSIFIFTFGFVLKIIEMMINKSKIHETESREEKGFQLSQPISLSEASRFDDAMRQYCAEILSDLSVKVGVMVSQVFHDDNKTLAIRLREIQRRLETTRETILCKEFAVPGYLQSRSLVEALDHKLPTLDFHDEEIIVLSLYRLQERISGIHMALKKTEILHLLIDEIFFEIDHFVEQFSQRAHIVTESQPQENQDEAHF